MGKSKFYFLKEKETYTFMTIVFCVFVFVLALRIAHFHKVGYFGVETDFYQDVELLEVEGTRVDHVSTGHTARMKLKNSAKAGDFVYQADKKGFALLPAIPIGVAALVGSSAAVTMVKQNNVNDELTPASPYKNK